MSNDTFPESHEKTWKGVVHTLIPSRHKKYRAALIAYLRLYPKLSVNMAAQLHGTTGTKLRVYLFNMTRLTPKQLATGDVTRDQIKSALASQVIARKRAHAARVEYLRKQGMEP